MQDPVLSEFLAVTSADESTALRLLRVHNNNLDAAVSAFFAEQTEEVSVQVVTQTTQTTQTTTPTTKTGPPPVPSRNTQKQSADAKDDWEVIPAKTE